MLCEKLDTYIFHINLYDVAFLGAIFVGLNFALLLWFTQTVNRYANRFLALALVTMILWMMRVLAIDIKLEGYLPHWNWLPMQFLLALGPLVYFYVLKITRPQYKLRLKDLLHLSPLLLELVALAVEISESARTGAATYATHAFKYINPVLQLLVFISNITYLYLCNKLILGFYRRLQPVLMDRPLVEFRWLRRLLAATAVLWCLWLVCAIINYAGYHNQPGLQAYYPFYIFFVVIIIWTAAAAFLKPQAAILAQPAALIKPPVPAELRVKGSLVKRAMEANLYYQDPELSLGLLAEKLKMPPHELSRVINTVFKKGFNDFINEYRVMDAARKMQDPAYDNMTLLGIAFEAGFNAQSSFTRIFKQLTGKSPAEFKKSCKKEFSSYNLSRQGQFARVISDQKATTKWPEMKLNRKYMFKNYLKTALRNLKRNKGYAAINITGLAVGVAACLLIFLVIQFETSFDTFHANTQRIYRVSKRFDKTGNGGYSRGICFPAGKQLPLDFPQLEQVASISSAQGDQLTVMDDNGRTTQKKFKEDGLFFIEPKFFSIFNFPFLAGNPQTALASPNTAILTQKAAEKYFGDWHNAMGKTIQYDNSKLCKVTGILQNLPGNTDFPVEVAISFKTLRDDSSRDWVSTRGNLNTYVVLPPSLSAESFSKSLLTFGKKHIPADYADKQTFVIQPLNEIHFDKRFGNYRGKTFGRELITALSIIGLFLLVIACINFINLSTAQAVNRAKEVGVRKVLGSRKRQLIIQFLCESFIITLTAVIVAFIVALLVLPLLNQLLETKITLRINGAIILFSMAAIVLVTVLSGLYPAIVLSGFNPITALKSKLTGNTKGGISLRRALVVLQFTVAQALIIGTLIVLSQMNYFKTAPMGFDKEAVVNIPLPGDSLYSAKLDAIKAQLQQQPGVSGISFSTFSISDGSHWGSDFTYDNAAKPVNFSADLKWADANIFAMYNLQMVAGKPYAPCDTIKDFVVNETLVKMLGLKSPNDAIGKKITFWDGYLKGHIVGVVKDFNGGSMANAISPVIMGTWKENYGNLSVKLQTQRVKPTLAAIEKIWTATYPNSVYEYQFLDDKIGSYYKQEEQLSQLYTIFACIAIFISCLGLYGLVSFMAAQRVKEIGIRKVLGASAGNIVYLFSKEFTLLIIIAFVIAAPVAYYFMHNWLKNFTFRITPGVGVFAVTIIASVAIAWFTAGYRAFKAALANPVKSLRTE